MKRILAFLIMLGIAFLAGCDTTQTPLQTESNFDDRLVDFDDDDDETPEQEAAALARIQALIDAHKAERPPIKQPVLHKNAAGEEYRIQGKITVPDDYATIQDAVNNASPGDKIKVKDGTYSEVVVVDVEDVRVTAEGDVTVDGFIVEADDVEIDNFNVIPPSDSDDGIVIMAVSGVEINDNTVSNAANAIHLIGSSECLIKDNTCTDSSDGIELDNAVDNVIEENTCLRNSGDGIDLDAGSNNNEIKGNNCSDNVSSSGGGDGIDLDSGSADMNTLEDNICNGNGDSGIEVTGDDNTIGSDNICNNNGDDGIELRSSSDNNFVKKNEASGNGGFDIDNNGTGNTFKKNDAGTTDGV